MNVLLVEDDPALANGVARALSTYEMNIHIVGNGLEVEAALQREKMSVMVLDIGLPGIDGFEVMRQLRASGNKLPVLLLTARYSVQDRVRGLEEGADDYLVKPFATIELIARIKALVRRSAANEVELKIGGLSLNTVSKRVYVNDRPVDLSVREWKTLEYLMQQASKVVSREQIIYSILSKGEEITPNAVEVYISRVRLKIADAGVVIRTIRGFGYLLEKC